MAIASSQLWTKGTSVGAATTGKDRLFIDDNDILNIVDEGGIVTKLKAILISSTDPVATTNPPEIDTVYINKVSGVFFVCTDATTDANVWKIQSHQNLSGVANPTISTNPSGAGILYTNTTTGVIFTCTDATAGANTWIGTDASTIP